jgi:hypothetical protein
MSSRRSWSPRDWAIARAFWKASKASVYRPWTRWMIPMLLYELSYSSLVAYTFTDGEGFLVGF